MTGGLLLDLDGTLVDSAGDLAEAVNDLRAELGLAALPHELVLTMVGDGLAKLVERALSDSDQAASIEAHTARVMALYMPRLTRLTRPYPGVPETLEALVQAGWRLGLCTNKPEAPARAILETFGLTRHFSAIFGGDSVALRKPDPTHPRAVLDQLGCGPEGAVMVGDSQVDLATGRNAGLPVVLVAYGYARSPVEGLNADLVIGDFTELPDALAMLRTGAAESPLPPA